MNNNPSQATYGSGLPCMNQGVWTDPDGASRAGHLPNSRSSTPDNKNARKTRVAKSCDSCREDKIKCDERKPCKSCTTKGRQCTTRYKGQTFRIGPIPVTETTEEPPGFEPFSRLTREQIHSFNGAVLHVPDNFANWAEELFSQRFRPPSDQQTVPCYEQSSAPPPTQQVPPERQSSPSGPTLGASVAGRTWPSVNHEVQTVLPPLRPMFGEDDKRGPRFPNTETLPSIGSFYLQPPIDRTGDDEGVRR